MLKRFTISILLLLLISPVFADEIIEDFEEESVVVLNEELRLIDKDIIDNTTDITTNTASVATNTTNITTNTTNITNQGIKAWVNFDGTTNVAGFCTIRDSYNVVSVADNAQGDYTITWDTDFANVNYALIGTAKEQGDTLTAIVSIDWTDGLAVGSARISVDGVDEAAADSPIVCIIAIGDQ